VSELSESKWMEALSGVIDPDLTRDVVSLGMVKNVSQEGNTVVVDLELTTPACPHKNELMKRCRKALGAVGCESVDVRMSARVRPIGVAGKQPVPGVKNLLAFASGKGGVGKSTVSINVALALSQAGAKVGMIDCDIYGPSVPPMLGLFDRPSVSPQQKMVPLQAHGLKVMSMGFLTEPTNPIAWRGPMVHKMIQQFMYMVDWGELDYLILDLPPGTGDVQLAVTQDAPLAAAVLITTPQNISILDARKGFEMFEQVKVPTLGVVENMSYYLCPHCDKEHNIFRQGGGEDLADQLGIDFLGSLPLHPSIPSDLGEGAPLMIRKTPEQPVAAFEVLAGKIAAKLAIQSFDMEPGTSYPMEV